MAAAEIQADGGQRDGRFALTKSEDFEAVQEDGGGIFSKQGSLYGLLVAIMTGTWQDDGNEVLADAYVGGENVITYEQLVRAAPSCLLCIMLRCR